MAFTQNPSLINNPEILTHYLICTAAIECKQCCQYSTRSSSRNKHGHLVTNIVNAQRCQYICPPCLSSPEINIWNRYIEYIAYIIYRSQYIWYISRTIYWSQYICSPCLSSPEINIWGLCIFQPERRQPRPFKSISGHNVYLWWVPKKLSKLIEKGFYAFNANLNILNIFTPKLTNGWPKVSFFILDAWQIECFCIVYCSASVFVWTMA